MTDSRSNAERASSGLVIALFLAAALLVGIILVQMIRDYNARSAPSENTASRVTPIDTRLVSRPLRS